MSTGNIFCDASMDIQHKIGCSGAMLVSEDFLTPIDYYYVKQINATNNSAEILAIYEGVMMAIYFKNRKDNNFDRFRIFSDSKVCIYGLREWIYNWVNNQNFDGTLRRSDMTPVLNQNRFKDIVRLILDYNVPISFVHQKGHTLSHQDDMSRNFFINTNGFTPESIGGEIKYFNKYNNEVDRISREKLYERDTHLFFDGALNSVIKPSEMSRFNALTHWI